MIEIEKFHTRVERLEKLMQEKLGGRGGGLRKRFARAGRLLPKHVQRAGRVLTDAQTAIQHPKLARLQNPKAINAAFTQVTVHLKTVDPSDRRKGMLLGMLGGMVFNVLLLIAAVLIVLRWQGVL